jgi:hypothetical protein
MSQMKGNTEKYKIKCNWAHDWTYSVGNDGLVICKNADSYTTAFFEIYPRNPDCYLRGEGDTIEEAEIEAFGKWIKILSCRKHDWERRGRKDGYAFCKHCNLSGTYLEPLSKCKICKKTTNYDSDKNENHYCKKHASNIPKKLRLEALWGKKYVKMPRKLKKKLKKAFLNALLQDK